MNSNVDGYRGMDRYQAEAMRTANMDLPREMKIATFALGIAGEAGEVADLLKKHLGHGQPLDREKLVKELGDVLWYVAALADVYGIELGAVAETNLAKLRARYPDGFSAKRSQERSTAPDLEKEVKELLLDGKLKDFRRERLRSALVARNQASFDANGSPVSPDDL